MEILFPYIKRNTYTDVGMGEMRNFLECQFHGIQWYISMGWTLYVNVSFSVKIALILIHL